MEKGPNLVLMKAMVAKELEIKNLMYGSIVEPYKAIGAKEETIKWVTSDLFDKLLRASEKW